MLFPKRSILLCLLLITLVASPTFAQKKGKGKPGSGDPPTPTVIPSHPDLEYSLTQFMTPDKGIYPSEGSGIAGRINDLNNFGQAVGKYRVPTGEFHAWVYAPTLYPLDAPHAIDLNDLTILDVPTGARIASAVGINDHGVVVGGLVFDGDVGYSAGFMLDLTEFPLCLKPVPNDPSWVTTYARQVNNNGDLLGSFQTLTGEWGAYLYNPGIPGVSDPTTEFIDVNLEHLAELNRAIDGASTIVSGTTSDGDAFFHIKGVGTQVIPLPNPVHGKTLVNDSGTLFGTTIIEVVRQIRKNKTETVMESRFFRDNGSLEILGKMSPDFGTFRLESGTMNNEGVVIGTTYTYGEHRLVALLPESNFLVSIGASLVSEDQAGWDPSVSIDSVLINTNGQIAAEIGSNFSSGVMFLLTPSPKYDGQ